MKVQMREGASVFVKKKKILIYNSTYAQCMLSEPLKRLKPFLLVN